MSDKQIFLQSKSSFVMTNKRKHESLFYLLHILFGKGHRYSTWIVADMRRATDLKFFLDNYAGRVTTVRITASDAVRAGRGFVFTAGVDDAESECGLDHITDWDLVIRNDGDDESSLEAGLRRLTGDC